MNDALREILAAASRGVVPGHLRARASSLLRRAGEKRAGPKKVLPASVAHVAARQRREAIDEREAIGLMRRHVFARNMGLTFSPWCRWGACDCGCGTQFRHLDDGELDHWRGRRGPDAHRHENGWRLASACHLEKTSNRPSVAEWNRRRQAYCHRAGVPFIPRRERS